MLVSQQDSAQEQSENLQVYLRVRPFTAAESDSGEPQVTHAVLHRHTYLLLWVPFRYGVLINA